jgi:hypothetical protein
MVKNYGVTDFSRAIYLYTGFCVKLYPLTHTF